MTKAEPDLANINAPEIKIWHPAGLKIALRAIWPGAEDAELSAYEKAKESIWEADYFIQGIAAGKTGYIGSQKSTSKSNNDPIYGRTAPTINAQQYLYSKYAPGDLRRDWAIAPYANRGETEWLQGLLTSFTMHPPNC
ncbi:hypothetical protein FQR65_LT15426 [Abscondita terminalis]|nr:hypothetical protein FQR65_LT15426 [Abscondita terminalis]